MPPCFSSGTYKASRSFGSSSYSTMQYMSPVRDFTEATQRVWIHLT